GSVARKEVAAARLVVPGGAIELAAFAPVLAHEQASRDGADVNAAWCTKGDTPQLEQLGVLEARFPGLVGLCRFLARHDPSDVAGALRIGDLGRVLPGLTSIGRRSEERRV